MHRGHTTRRRAFTLIEVLASMAILMLIMLALVRMFNEAGKAYSQGTISVNRASSARAAMDLITHDLEGMVVDRRLPMYKEADAADPDPGFGFDEIFFVTMQGDQDDGRSYQAIHYYVGVETNVVEGVRYRYFRLMRGTANSDIIQRGIKVNLLQTPKPSFDWWSDLESPTNRWTDVMIANNVVRFDIYVHDESGHLIQSPGGWVGNRAYVDSSRPCNRSAEPSSSAPSAYPTNIPPAYLDVYFQVASDDTMKRAGITLIQADVQSNPELRQTAHSLLYRESNVLITRIYPAMAAGQFAHPLEY